MLMMLASPLSPSGPLSECPGANLNLFFFFNSKQLGHLLKRGYNLARQACILNIYIYINGVPPETKYGMGFHDYECAFSDLIAPWRSLDVSAHPRPPTPIPDDLSPSRHSLRFWSSAQG